MMKRKLALMLVVSSFLVALAVPVLSGGPIVVTTQEWHGGA